MCNDRKQHIVRGSLHSSSVLPTCDFCAGGSQVHSWGPPWGPRKNAELNFWRPAQLGFLMQQLPELVSMRACEIKATSGQNKYVARLKTTWPMFRQHLCFINTENSNKVEGCVCLPQIAFVIAVCPYISVISSSLSRAQTFQKVH